MDDRYNFHHNSCKTRKESNDKKSEPLSFISKLFRDLRSGSKESPKVVLPLGRTLSANAKDRERKLKLSRTQSACQKSRGRTDINDCLADVAAREKFKSNNSARSRTFIDNKEEKSKIFCPFDDHGEQQEEKLLVPNQKVNKNVLVSFLDEGSLLASRQQVIHTRESTVQDDGFIMPVCWNNNSEFDPSRDNHLLKESSCSSHELKITHEYENLPGLAYDPNEVPARDPASLKFVRYGPGHEKFPSWPGSLQAAANNDKPYRSHSWTEQTPYPRSNENINGYVRPNVKRSNAGFNTQLKTVMEKCEKISPESYQNTESRLEHLYLPKVDREGKTLGDNDYLAPSPPERDSPPIVKADLNKYYRLAQSKPTYCDYATPYEDFRVRPYSQNEIDEFETEYDESLKSLHQHQGSYAQSEGYHSYVSSSELTSTPFLDRLRQENDSINSSCQLKGPVAGHWSSYDAQPVAGRDSVVTNTSSGSITSNETLKCLSSGSEVSSSNNSCRSRQLIAHSSRVAHPERLHSESVSYGNSVSPIEVNLPPQNRFAKNSKTADRAQQLKLFPINTYTVQPPESYTSKTVISPTSQPQFSVAERISELERQQKENERLVYLDPGKRCKVSDPTLKAIQKKALLHFYERHQNSSGSRQKSQDCLWKSEPQLSQAHESPPPPPPPPRQMYLNAHHTFPEDTKQSESHGMKKERRPMMHSASVGSLFSSGKSAEKSCSAIESWVPERPPKKPHLKLNSALDDNANPPTTPVERPSSPDLPPPPPPPPVDPSELFSSSDDPLPPPPEAEWLLATAVPGRSTPSSEHPSIIAFDSTSVEEIQYDASALNAILESNNSHLRRKKSLESRPPLPLPRDSHGLQVDDLIWFAQYDKTRQKKSLSQTLDVHPNSPFVRSMNDAKYGARASLKVIKSSMTHRMSLRYVNDTKERLLNENTRDNNRAKMKCVSDYEPKRIWKEGDSELKVFSRRMSQEFPLEETNSCIAVSRSNSKAAHLAMRRERELTVTSYEGSYKHNINQSDEYVVEGSNEKSFGRGKFDQQHPLEPPDLIPKLSSLSCKSASGSVPEIVDASSQKEFPANNEKSQNLHTSTDNIEAGLTHTRHFQLSNEVHTDIEKTANEEKKILPQEDENKKTLAVKEDFSQEQMRSKSVSHRQSKKHLVERSTSFGRTDFVKVIEIPTNELSVTPVVSDATSQTDFSEEVLDENEIACERLSRDLASHLSSNHVLISLLAPANSRKKTTDYIDGLFNLHGSERCTSASGKKLSNCSSSSGTSSLNSVSLTDGSISSDTISVPFASESKPLITTTAVDVPKPNEIVSTWCESGKDTLSTFVVRDSMDLQRKKEELVRRLECKLGILRAEQLALDEESVLNDELGQTVAAQVARVARPYESTKYRLHVEEVAKITSLLLGLSGRLARVENAIAACPDVKAEERKFHESKRDKLQDQLEEAKSLKKSIDRRSESICQILTKYLCEEDLADYLHFIRMKEKLIVDSKELLEKIALGEEQLAALREPALSLFSNTS